jgi:hypothetical protein
MSYAIITERGCGIRKAGGLYAECGVGPGGKQLDEYIIDRPIPVPASLDLVNKATLYLDEEGRFGPRGVKHIMIYVGQEHYRHVFDYIEETRRFGASRRLPSNFPTEQLTPFASKMLLCHREAYVANWAELTYPIKCRKHVEGHEDGFAGPCLYKALDLIPESDGNQLVDWPADFGRTIGRTTYLFTPVRDETPEWGPAAFFLALPISGFALIADAAGRVNAAAKKKLDDHDQPYYESPM